MQRPQLSFWQIWNMCFGFFGIQVGFGLQNANVSRIFQSLGAEVDEVAILWIAAPMTGLLVQPIIGYLSDRTWSRMGRRRPYFFYGAIATTIALCFMPNAPALWIAAGLLWIMDASINVTMEPFRAFVGDMMPQRQRTIGFAMQSFFIGAGAVFASALPWMLTNWFHIANTAEEGEIPPSVKLAFYIGGACVLIAVLWTVFTTKEYPPEEMEKFEAYERQHQSKPGSEEVVLVPASTYLRWGGAILTIGLLATFCIVAVSQGYLLSGSEALKLNDLYFISGALTVFGAMLLIAGALSSRQATDNAYSTIFSDLFSMPRAMKQLAVVQFFSWFALFSMWIHATPGITAWHYGTTDTSSALYNTGADWVGLLFAIYNGVAALAAFTIPVIAARTSRKFAHMLNLSLGGLGLISILLIRDPALLWISMIGVGIAWASILSVPYSILTGSLPSNKFGVYMGIFNFFIVIPQLLAASILGVFVKYVVGGEAIYALALGGASLLIAAIATSFVDDKAEG